MYYNTPREVKRHFWDVALMRFYFYKRLDGVNDDLIFKIFTTITSDEAIALLKKYESKMIMLDKIITDFI